MVAVEWANRPRPAHFGGILAEEVEFVVDLWGLLAFFVAGEAEFFCARTRVDSVFGFAFAAKNREALSKLISVRIVFL